MRLVHVESMHNLRDAKDLQLVHMFFLGRGVLSYHLRTDWVRTKNSPKTRQSHLYPPAKAALLSCHFNNTSNDEFIGLKGHLLPRKYNINLISTDDQCDIF